MKISRYKKFPIPIFQTLACSSAAISDGLWKKDNCSNEGGDLLCPYVNLVGEGCGEACVPKCKQRVGWILSNTNERQFFCLKGEDANFLTLIAKLSLNPDFTMSNEVLGRYVKGRFQGGGGGVRHLFSPRQTGPIHPWGSGTAKTMKFSIQNMWSEYMWQWPEWWGAIEFVLDEQKTWRAHLNCTSSSVCSRFQYFQSPTIYRRASFVHLGILLQCNQANCQHV